MSNSINSIAPGDKPREPKLQHEIAEHESLEEALAVMRSSGREVIDHAEDFCFAAVGPPSSMYREEENGRLTAISNIHKYEEVISKDLDINGTELTRHVLPLLQGENYEENPLHVVVLAHETAGKRAREQIRTVEQVINVQLEDEDLLQRLQSIDDIQPNGLLAQTTRVRETDRKLFHYCGDAVQVVRDLGIDLSKRVRTESVPVRDIFLFLTNTRVFDPADAEAQVNQMESIATNSETIGAIERFNNARNQAIVFLQQQLNAQDQT